MVADPTVTLGRSSSTTQVPFLSLAVPSFGPTIVVVFTPSDFTTTSPVSPLAVLPNVAAEFTVSVFEVVPPAAVKPVSAELSSTPLTLLTCISLLESL